MRYLTTALTCCCFLLAFAALSSCGDVGKNTGSDPFDDLDNDNGGPTVPDEVLGDADRIIFKSLTITGNTSTAADVEGTLSLAGSNNLTKTDSNSNDEAHTLVFNFSEIGEPDQASGDIYDLTIEAKHANDSNTTVDEEYNIAVGNETVSNPPE